ncbi:MAG: imidazole glycerol phosphate synthase subunit HisH [Methylacidiphilales bacterium]|nr:imidazole glycerol phosphate synthase subunit HisH [Candidatus Methylacidiphilales bacterium]MDW8348743.1 imidazole glycerol phosphate synthase subunit HisH [Verrucomicrobiae bacterium]
MIGVIDYGMGNLRSVEQALEYLKTPHKKILTPDDLNDCLGLILPGVGAFGDCMNNLQKAGLISAIHEWVTADRPFLGICLGYQALFESSEESPGIPGLKLLQGRVVRFKLSTLKVPHMGWNTITITNPHSPIVYGLREQDSVYFVHSYYPEGLLDETVILHCTYGVTFAAAAGHKNLFGTQFHPEKSQRVGLKILENFIHLSHTALHS